MVDLAMGIFEILIKFLLIWHPWHLWVCVHSGLKQIEAIPQKHWGKMLSIFEYPKMIFHKPEKLTWKANTKWTLVVQQSGTLWHVIDPMHFGKRTNYSIPFPQLDSESAKLSIFSKRLMPEQLAPPFKTFYCLHCDLQSIISFENLTSS